MKKIKNSIHYHNVLKFKELETALTVKEAWMNSDSVTEKANIMWAAKERFNQQERDHNNQDNKFTNNNDQSNNQSNQNSEQSQYKTVFCDRDHDKDHERFFNNHSNNISFIDSDKRSSQNIEKSMMTRILFTEFKESTKFIKILNQTAQSINKLTKWLADTDVICHITNSC